MSVYRWRAWDADGECWEFVDRPEWNKSGGDVGEWFPVPFESMVTMFNAELDRESGGPDALEWIGEGPDPRGED